jgi:hypothetical protein
MKTRLKTWLLAVLLTLTGLAQARDTERFVVTDTAGKELLAVEQVYNGKRPKSPNTRPSRDPEKFETDFYQMSFKNLTTEPIVLKRMALGMRHGAGTVVGIKKGDANEAWGAGLQELNLETQPMFDKNVFSPGKVYSREYFVTANIVNYMDRVIQIEHLGKTYELKWGMKFSFGE